MRRAAGLVLLAVAFAPGCRASEIYRPAVQLHLAVQPTAVRAGDTVQMEFTVSNPERDSVVLEFGGDCRAAFLVLDGAQRAVHPRGPDSACMDTGPRRLVIPAGSTWKAAGAWRALADDGTPLPAGDYAIRAVLRDHASVVRGRRDVKLGHAADTAGIRILPAGGE